MSDAAAFSKQVRPCARCELPPPANLTTGDLHCWFPADYVAGKVRAALRQFGISGRPSVGDGTVFHVDPSPSEAIAEALGDALSTVELDDARALFCLPDVAPTPSDIARLEPLSRVVIRARSGWLLAAMRERRLTSHFQPIVHADRPDQIYGYEALLRGVNPDGSFISPGALFETARGAGLLFQLDLAARRSAIANAHAHQLKHALFVNFAPTAIYDPKACLRSTVAAIDDARIERSQVVFEIVETERTHDPKHLRRILDYYRDAGCRIALDDVGSGYSSLNLIHLLRPDVVKLDMELVRDVDRDPYKARIAANLLDIANALGIDALAEGIETEGELERVQQHGAKYVQGFLIARPAPIPLSAIPQRSPVGVAA
ncbi:EAL domain-containing protein [Gemmatimonas sp.]|uniref:EAL domain-containing protein n=1 Tax=Gemmatimonas sp. TaxID=1962908 RepID=UPI0039834DDE